MIYTNESIRDPELFLQAEESVVGELQDGDSELISGDDIDMLVTKYDLGDDVLSVGRNLRVVSKVLGRLYLSGSAQGIVIGDSEVQVSWYPSPKYVNNLMQELGLRPGEDTFAFTHCSMGGDIPANEYFRHLQAGEYPLSTQSRRFDHDRHDDHAIGVILAPPMFAQSMMKMIGRYKPLIPRKDPDALPRKGSVKYYVQDFDYLTTGMSWQIRDFADELDQDFQDVVMRGESLYPFPSSFLTEKKSRLESRHDFERRAGEVLFNHLVELKPRIDELQKSIAPLRATV